MKTTAEIETGLAYFNGAVSLTRHWTGRLKYTEGVAWLADAAEAYWLIDLIASYQGKPVASCDDVQFWELEVTCSSVVARCRRDNGIPPCVEQTIEYTDFPLKDGIRLLVAADVLMLPSEY